MRGARIIAIVLAGFAIGWGSGCSPAPEADAEIVRPVYVFRVGDPMGGRLREFAGTARPAVETEISFRVAGEIVELPIRPGSEVRQGDLLARLDPTDYELQVKQAEAQLSQADSMLKQASSQFDRVRNLYETESASKSDLDDARAAFDSATAQYEAVLKALQMARSQLGYCVLAAPFEGKIASRPVDIRQTVNAGQTIATLTSGDAMQMVLGIPEALINQVNLGDTASVRFDALAGETFEATVAEVGYDATGAGVYPVKLKILGDTRRIRPGMVGEATKKFGADGPGALLVPAVCVVGNPDGTHHAWVVGEDNRIERCPVEVGALTSDGLEIRSGLESGDRVVTRGVHKVTEGITVRVME